MKIDENLIFNRLKSSAKKRKIKFTITKLDLMNLSWPLTCPILGIKLEWNAGQADDNSYSIDRIDSNRGYEADNIIVISNKANRMKNNGSLEELNAIAEYYKNLYVSSGQFKMVSSEIGMTHRCHLANV